VVPDEQLGPCHDVHQEVWFTAQEFECQVCRLLLDSEEEVDAAGMDTAWEIDDADPSDYEPPTDEDDAYDRWREEREEREGL